MNKELVSRLRRNVYQIKHQLTLRYPKQVRFKVAGQEFRIFGTYSSDHGFGKDFARNGCHEPVLSRLLYDTLRSGPPEGIYWDVGASSGYFVSIAATLIPPNHVHAFEPGPAGAYLEYNNRHLFGGDVRVIRARVTDNSNGKGDSVLLDHYAKEYGYPHVIKIDVDGVECEVLRGARETLQRALPVLFLEVHFFHPAAYGDLRSEIITILDELPYNYRLCRNHRRMNGQCEPLPSLAMLPQMRDESFDDPDYLLIAYPKTTT
jgi:hypothetical protein